MSSLDTLGIETAVLIQATFFAALLFLVLYTRHRWWKTIHGLTLGWLSIGVMGVLLRGVLTQWHVMQPRDLTPDWTAWVTVQAIVILPLVFLTMSWQLVRPHARPWLVRHHLARDYARRPRRSRQPRPRHPSSR